MRVHKPFRYTQHMKDCNGGEHYLGYCPLGQGKVNIPALVDLLESSGNDLMMIMAELDPSPAMPLAPLEAARINKSYMQSLGYTFKS
jgi:inosose dehydratase